MSLQYKISALFLAVFLLFGILTYAVQQLVILPSFMTLERQDAKKDMERAVQAIHREIEALVQPTGEWASWNDSYRFIEDNNREFLESNLTKSAIIELLRADLLYFVDVTGNVVWSVVYDPHNGDVIRLDELSGKSLPLDHPLLALPNEDSQAKGLLGTTYGPIILVSKPSLDSNSRGPAHGALVFGRFLDAATIDRIAKQIRVELSVMPLDGAALDPEQAAVAAELGNASGKALLRADDNENRVYHILPDIFGKPALLLQVKVPKLISAEGRAANRNARIALVGAALLILSVLLLGLRYLVLAPIAQLTAYAQDVGHSSNLSLRANMNRTDELGRLAREFDQMVERLSLARKELLKQSHQAGVAEMASGVLHNIGNAITPLKVRVANLESTLRQAPVTELGRALTELGEASTPDQRRADLREFVDLAARELASLVETTVAQLVSVAHQVEHVQQIISDQESVSRAARKLEPVPVAALAHESVELLGDDLQHEVHIALDAGLEAVGPVLGSHVALQQILINMLKNAVESVHDSAPAPGAGHIALSATEENRDDRAMVRLCVTDNGVGIAPENVPRLFKRGFSTKQRTTSGQGLHWCAVTAAALGGQIEIESAGTGRGARVSLWLARAEL